MKQKEAYRKYKNNLFFEGGLSFANFTLLNGVFLIGFALAIGANNFQIGILVSIPLFANLIQLFSAYILEATGTKKWTTIASHLVGRGLWIVMILIAFGIIGINKITLIFFTIILLISSLFISIGNLSLLSWMKDLVPENLLAKFWGKRNTYASIAGIIVYLTGSFLVDRFTGIKIFGYIFGAGMAFGIITLLILLPLPERKRKIKAINPKKFIKRLKIPFNDDNFRPLVIFGIAWTFSINIASAYFLVYLIKDLKVSFFIVTFFLVTEIFARVLGLRTFPPFVEKYGAKPNLKFTATIATLTPFVFLFVNESNYIIGLVMYFIVGYIYAGFDIAIGQILFKSASRKYDAYYLSSYTALTNVAAAIGPIIGGLIALIVTSNSHNHYFNLMPALKYVFLVSFVFRLSSLSFINNIIEPAAGDVKDIIIRVKQLKYMSFLVSIFSFANYTSRLVLEPQKQLFFLQRKVALRMKKDVHNSIDLITKAKSSLKRIRKTDYNYFKKKIRQINKDLEEHLSELFYFKGTHLHRLPHLARKKLHKFQKNMDDKPKVTIHKDADKIEIVLSNYHKKLKKSLEEDIKK